MFEELKDLEEKFDRLEAELASPEVLKDQKLYQKTARQHAGLGRVVSVYRRLRKYRTDLEGARELIYDPDDEIRQMAKTEAEAMRLKVAAAEEELKVLLLPQDPNDEKNIVLEIRAGTGGEEAALFVADLFRMYARFAEGRGWNVEVLSSHPTGAGGFKEIILLIE
ncbi:MAG: PCRF domain-containing protein, partial [Thermodesulfobacteriota bacterium]